MDREFSEFANALLALRMGKSTENPVYPTVSFSEDDQCDSVSIGFNEDDLFKNKLSNNNVPFPSLSWASHDFAGTYGFVDRSTPTKGKKRVHSVSLSASSSESNDSYDVELPRVKKLSSTNTEKKISLARGRYRCSLCGAFKTNHVCALVADKLMCTVSTQSLQASDLVASMLPAHQKELRVQCKIAPSEVTSRESVGSTGPTVNSVFEGARAFRERIVTVTRNRTSIQCAEPSATEAEALNSTGTPITTSESSNDGSSVITMRKSLEVDGKEVSVRAPITEKNNAPQAVTTVNAVAPVSTYAFTSHLSPHYPHGNTMFSAGPAGGYMMYANSTQSSLLSVPLQPTTLSATAVPSFPSVHHRQAPVKTAPSLIYPSALDLLGHSIYE